MAMHVPKAPGFAQMLKDGAKHFSGLEEAVYKNIDACKELSRTTRSSFGPHATILQELEVQHPAAKMLVLATHQQEQEVGDGTNFVLVFAGALLEQAEFLLRMGLSVTEVTEGYELALKKALEILPVSVMAQKSTFNVDSIRVSKILGAGVLQSSLVQGMVFRRAVEGEVTKMSKAKIVVYSCPLDIMQTETKNAEELINFSQGEENFVEQQIKAISDTGCKVIVSGGKVGEMATHFCNKYGVLVLRLMSKWDLRRLCKAVGATPLPRVTAPTVEESGYCDNVYLDEIGDTPVIVFRQDKAESAITTIVIRGSTDNIMDDMERAVNDGVNTYKALTRDVRMVPGAGATEIEVAKQITTLGESTPGLEQYAIKKFAEALEVATEVLSLLYAAHQEGKKNVGVDIEAVGAGVCDAADKGILDLYLAKYWGLKFATAAACTVLRVDQIIMAKMAGGPKPKAGGARDDDD
ncbi:TCPQ-like protein [Mya arenaria]|uniref:T-complex protein 1 subunit theta n=1 Tax=Mya arenaria TaxID=6604 RepID=A0ABY7EJ45_MYAAR|nr:TCPQ-like protein [Mya arenaria]